MRKQITLLDEPVVIAHYILMSHLRRIKIRIVVPLRTLTRQEWPSLLRSLISWSNYRQRRRFDFVRFITKPMLHPTKLVIQPTKNDAKPAKPYAARGAVSQAHPATLLLLQPSKSLTSDRIVLLFASMGAYQGSCDVPKSTVFSVFRRSCRRTDLHFARLLWWLSEL